MVCLSPVGYGFDQQRLIWYVCRLWDMGLINKGLYGMFVACGTWCVADVSSVSPSSEQTALPHESKTHDTLG